MRQFVQGIAEAQKAADLNYDGLIIESHICPDKAWSDASQQITPEELEKLLMAVKWRSEAVDRPEFVRTLDEYRIQIDQLDGELLDILSKRMAVAEKIGEVKRDNDVTILQSGRWSDIVDRVLARSEDLKLSREFLSTVLEAIHLESINRQNSVMNR